ncbi:MAG: amidohydrolase family protein [Pseudomonadota bacterium]
MTRLTLTDALMIAPPDSVAPGGQVDIEIVEGAIAEIRPAEQGVPRGQPISASGRLVTPGLINGHHHSHEHYHKGRYDRLPLELWMNYVRPLSPIPLSARQVYLRTMVGAIQALRSGTTTIIDDLNVSPVLISDHVDAALQAYEDVGIRALVGPTLFDRPFFRALPFVEDEFPEDLLERLSAVTATPPSEVLDFVRAKAIERHPRETRVAILAAPSAPQRCTDGFLRQVRAMADELALPVIIHVQETRLQAVTAKRFYGRSMFAHLYDLGFLKPATSLIHAVWVTPEDIRLIAASGASVQHNPNSNMKLGSGLMPMRAMLDAGVNVSLGTDGCGSIDTVDMLRAVASTALVQKLRGDDPDRWIDAEKAFAAATTGGAQALGQGDRLGRIAPGMRADLALWRLDSIPFVPLNDPLRQLVYGETGASLDRLIVDGEIVMVDGRLTRIDEAAILAEIAEAHAEIEPSLAAAEAEIEAMMPAYRRIVTRCHAEIVDPAILPARFP